ncbi:MAG: N-acetyl-alpha-D-glucosaminyl L-malate synthase BshA [Gemmatimonadota bacterium]|nr:N-acetyl-alpha-D-glucosaminyl L-malate synthase BshA [Gemmatimonadota bacterium]
MRIAMVCHASHGGSGILATELGTHLAARGCEVHFITNDVPVRLDHFEQNLYFHRVEVDTYPVFAYTPYSLSLASKIMEVIGNHGLDIIHAHYAVPHATSAFLAREMSARPVRTVTTLHGTDITLVGVRPSYYDITKFSMERSDRVTAVSEWLRRKTLESFPMEREIDVIHNLVDTERFRPWAGDPKDRTFSREGDFVVMHASNFRRVKNIPTVLRVFEQLQRRVSSRLVMVGDGPERPAAEELVREMGICDRVHFLGAQENVEELFPLADAFVLPSAHESFGLVALEAMSAGVAVVATATGGTGEVIEHGRNSFLHDPADQDGMVASLTKLAREPEWRREVARAGRETAEKKFGVERIVSRYLEVYEGALS